MAILVAAPALAQAPATPGPQTAVPHHERIYQMMKDMTEQMGQMSDQMARGPLSLEQRKEMSRRMVRMSTMMRRLSGLEAGPALKENEWQRQMGQMRKQMDEMKQRPLAH